ncbi:putative virion structural protein [Aeromonas phage ZPAH34]|uniref:putative virion structural protein n=1 Tax=Aeromonas phage ZPAH34 TaxID=2924888 RepID=UPI002329859E|nr:putative virion structural protein [Aeromonas phage ZPAH34]UOX39608.1 putative virion structural protein [Aeromonas phage ZPAH34]
MLHIKDTRKGEVINVIEREQNYLVGLKDNLVMLSGVSDKVKDEMMALINQNAILKSINGQVKKGLNSQTDLIRIIGFGIENIELWMGRLKDLVNKSSTQVYDEHTVTFKERGILDAISAINFFNRYTTMIIDVLTTYGYDKTDVSKQLTKVDYSFFTDTANYYATLLIRFNQPAKALSEMIEQLSDEVVDNLSEEIVKGVDGIGAVSIKEGLSPHQLNPVHWYLLWVMKRDVRAIKTAQARIDLLAMKIARLNNKSSGLEDPTLDHQIEIYTDQIIKDNAYIRQIREKYNG